MQSDQLGQRTNATSDVCGEAQAFQRLRFRIADSGYGFRLEDVLKIVGSILPHCQPEQAQVKMHKASSYKEDLMLQTGNSFAHWTTADHSSAKVPLPKI